MQELVDRMQDNMLAYFRLFVGLPGIIAHDDHAVSWFLSTVGEPGNNILRANLSDPDIQIDAILAQIGRSTDHVDWFVFPGCRPANLGAFLAARGMQAGPGGIWMTTDLAVLPEAPASPPGFRVTLVQDAADLDTWAAVSAAGFGIDVQMHHAAYAQHGFGSEAFSLHYIGYQGDTPVTSGTLLLAGKIAGIWDVSTPPAARGQGYAAALTLAMLHVARERGQHDGWVWSSRMGQRTYEQIGFITGNFGVREYQWRKGAS